MNVHIDVCWVCAVITVMNMGMLFVVSRYFKVIRQQGKEIIKLANEESEE